jgi:hypothetical protein
MEIIPIPRGRYGFLSISCRMDSHDQKAEGKGKGGSVARFPCAQSPDVTRIDHRLSHMAVYGLIGCSTLIDRVLADLGTPARLSWRQPIYRPRLDVSPENQPTVSLSRTSLISHFCDNLHCNPNVHIVERKALVEYPGQAAQASERIEPLVLLFALLLGTVDAGIKVDFCAFPSLRYCYDFVCRVYHSSWKNMSEITHHSTTVVRGGVPMKWHKSHFQYSSIVLWNDPKRIISDTSHCCKTSTPSQPTMHRKASLT